METMEKTYPSTGSIALRLTTPPPTPGPLKLLCHRRERISALARSGGILYAIGGYNGNDMDVVDAYNPSTNTWSGRAPMPTPRGGHAVAVSNGILYALGGRLHAPGAPYSIAKGDSPEAGRLSAGNGTSFFAPESESSTV